MLKVEPHQFKALLVYPRFLAQSFWNYRATCEVVGARYPGAPLGLITVAAMLPRHWSLRLVNCNTEELTEEDIAWADVVMTGGMMAQQIHTLELIDLCKDRGKRVVVGGPDISSSPQVYGRADFQVIGEAEHVVEGLAAALERGDPCGVFEAEKFKTDVTTSPVPRFDLLRFEHYLHVGVQFSRGCPFTCEFCDIIELYGRVPRAKSNEQMLAELDALYGLGYRGWVDFVDDNMIGNKKALKKFLPKLAKWQKEHGFPFEFSTEASINLADDEELLEMLRQSNFFAVFIGIETPDSETLVATSKKQNTRRDLVESVHKIYNAGMFVTAGFIVGFDGEKNDVTEQIVGFIENAAIPVCMVGLLFALPNTQLTRRLHKEGRLFPNYDVVVGNDCDQCTLGLNFDTYRSRNEILRDCQAIVRTVYDPKTYFARVRRVALALDCSKHRLPGAIGKNLRDFALVVWRLTQARQIWPHFWRLFIECAGKNPRALGAVIKLSALYLHFGPFSEFVVKKLDQHIREQTTQWQRPLPLRERTTAAGHVPRLAVLGGQPSDSI